MSKITVIYPSLDSVKAWLKEQAAIRAEMAEHARTQRDAARYRGWAEGLDQALSALNSIEER